MLRRFNDMSDLTRVTSDRAEIQTRSMNLEPKLLNNHTLNKSSERNWGSTADKRCNPGLITYLFVPWFLYRFISVHVAIKNR